METAIFSVCAGTDGVSQATLYADLLDDAVVAERYGLDGIWVGEHHFSEWGTIRNTLLWLAAASQRTSRIRLGAGVVVLPLHHPLRVAEEAAMVDHLSGGRLELGIGRGARPHELAGYGVDYESRRQRYADARELLVRALCGDPVSYQGELSPPATVTVLPRPAQHPRPRIWEAVTDPESLRDAARRGHHLLTSARDAGYEAMAETIALFRKAAGEAGHTEARVAVSAQVYLGASASEVQGEGLMFLRRFFGEGSATTNDPNRPTPKSLERYFAMSAEEIAQNYAVETPELLVERLRRLQRMTDGGIDMFLAVPQFGGQSHEVARRTLERFARVVAPSVRDL